MSLWILFLQSETGEELKTWVAERRVDMANVECRTHTDSETAVDVSGYIVLNPTQLCSGPLGPALWPTRPRQRKLEALSRSELRWRVFAKKYREIT